MTVNADLRARTAWDDRIMNNVTGQPLSLPTHMDFVASAAQGAVASFVGQVRDHDPAIKGTVTALEYSAHPDAEDHLRSIISEVLVREDRRGEARVAASHRVGMLYVGDLAMIVAVSAPHREVALRINAELVEAIKHGIPVWKKQFNSQGDYVWSGLDC